MGFWDKFNVSNTVSATSGNVGATAAVATLTAPATPTGGNATQQLYVTGLELTASGASSGLAVTATLAGLVGGTLSWSFNFPTGVTVGANPLVIQFVPPLPVTLGANAVLTLPSGGSGNTNACATLHGIVA